MNIWHSIVITVKHAVAAVLIVVGLQAPAQAPQATIVDVQPDTQQVTVSLSPTGAPTVSVPDLGSKTKIQTPQSLPEATPAEPTPAAEAPSLAPQPAAVPVYIIQQPTIMTQEPTPAPESQPAAAAPSYTMEIISPMPAHGLGRHYVANDYAYNPDGSLKQGTEPKDENSIDIGVVVYDQNGQPQQDITITITATDKGQNKTLSGTGNVTKIYPNGEPQTVHYYPFHYDFRSVGDHTITFTLPTGESKTVTLTAE